VRPDDISSDEPGTISRRDLLGGAAKVGAATGALALTSGALLTACGTASSRPPAAAVVPYTGPNQAGIATPPPGRLVYAAFDLTTAARADVRTLLQRWSAAVATLTRGLPTGAVQPKDPTKPPGDTGEAVGLGPANLTVTIGFGRTLFVDAHGHDRFGLASQLPPPLVDIPAFPRDALDPARSGGDLSIQCCADDPQVAFHAFHNFARIAHGTARPRWVQLGFGPTSTAGSSQPTPRNLMGFKDGTNNLNAHDNAMMREHVWVAPADEPEWMRNGTYVVVRRIHVHLTNWDTSAISDQELTIGRSKLEGAPIGRTHEHDPVDLSLITTRAHIHAAAPSLNGGVRLLRRGYNFADGVDAHTGEVDAGLFFIAYQRDPRKQFIPLQRRLDHADALNEYIVHVAGAAFAVPPGVASGGFVGETLF